MLISNDRTNDRLCLLKALDCAIVMRGFCAPNPSVGAVIADENGRVWASGFHSGPGNPHAEIEAIKQLDVGANGLTLYVTLEPCCHQGRTPPCTDAIIKSGIKRVVYGFRDPNNIVSGRGAHQLRETGIQCDLISLPEIKRFYASYLYWTNNKIPFVTSKIAITSNGMIAGINREPIRITGEKLRRVTHEYRKLSDAILTSVATINNDNPQLNVRLSNDVISKPIYIIDRLLRINMDSIVLNQDGPIIIFHSLGGDLKKLNHLQMKGVRCIETPESDGKLDLSEILNIIGLDGVHDLWVEAGREILTSMLSKKLINKLMIYLSSVHVENGYSLFENNPVFKRLFK